MAHCTNGTAFSSVDIDGGGVSGFWVKRKGVKVEGGWSAGGEVVSAQFYRWSSGRVEVEKWWSSEVE